MARAIHRLTDRGCKSAKGPKLFSDGGGLYLNVGKSNARSWSYIWRKGDKRNEMGLGGYPDVSLARARALAAECRECVAAGGNPLTERRRTEVPSFGECADQFIASMEGQWKNDKHRAQWRMTLETYAGPIRQKSVADIDTNDVLMVLNAIWETRPETASRLRGRIERVLDYAKAHGWRSGENPALWRGHLRHVLPARSKLTRGHHAAMPYQDVPAFIEKLRAHEAVAARALEFLILTSARSGEVREAKWDELNLETNVWTVPGFRMKSGIAHRVPLSKPALAILNDLSAQRISDYVFPGQVEGKAMSNMAYAMLMRRMKLGEYTVHGFRSSFRDWAGDDTSYPRELAEHAQAHQVGGEGYRRVMGANLKARIQGRNHMSNSNFTRRGLLKAGAGAGAALATPTLFTGAVWAASHAGYTNAPTGSTVTFGFNVPQTKAYADEGADELRAQELAVEHINGGGDGGMLNTFSSKALDGTGVLGKKVEYVTGDTATSSDVARASAKSMIEKDGAVMINGGSSSGVAATW